MQPRNDELWFVPLGGTGEIGMNLNLYGTEGRWLMVDCGVTFNEPLVRSESASVTSPLRSAVVAPDPSFIAQQSEYLVGIVLTHAHEDHLGALPYLWKKFKCPVYTTAFTAEVLRRKLISVGLDGKVPVIVIDPNVMLTLGPFCIEWLSLTHSIPDPYALLISTSLGAVLHTADWKIDPQPQLGAAFRPELFRQLAERGVIALVGDSTNANKPGFSVSERTCFDGLLGTVKGLSGRVVVSCFGSNVARLITLAKIAKQTGRYVALLGRALENMVSVARQCGYWPSELTFIDPLHVGYLPANEVMVIATGSQGEPRAVLHRLAVDSHPALSLTAGDTVVFSSIVIPGNELAVERLIHLFTSRDIQCIQSESSTLPIHASGHPCQEELMLMYQWVRPRISIPVHGERQHLQAHAEVAKKAGVPITYVGENGDLYCLAPQPRLRRGVVKVGRIAIERT